jgi:hypothetical protein
MSKRTVLSVVSRREVFSLRFEPVNYGVGIFLYGRGENYEVEPFGDLGSRLVRIIIRELDSESRIPSVETHRSAAVCARNKV